MGLYLMKIKMKHLGLFLFAVITFSACQAQKITLPQGKAHKIAAVGFYNLENLFDTLVDPDTNKILQEDFTPVGYKEWNTPKYKEKLANMSKVISQIGTNVTPDGLAVLGVCEIENKLVLEDLVKQPAIAKRNYQIVHYDSPDARGIDVGFIYNPNYFKVTGSKSYRLAMEGNPNFRTRDQLLVSGTIEGEKMHFIVCHWPSRRGGAKKSNPKRVAAGELARHISDSLLKEDPNAKICVMGDLNDYPHNESIKEGLGAEGKWNKLEEGDFYNPMEKMDKDGIGTHYWKDTPGVFDQMIISKGFVPNKNNFSEFKFYKANVFSKGYLKNQSGQWAGYPFRTYVGSTYQGGYSDHLPVYMLLVKQVK